jgi:hypothetical protein
VGSSGGGFVPRSRDYKCARAGQVESGCENIALYPKGELQELAASARWW